MPNEPIILTANDVVAAPPALIRVGIESLPAAITAAGADTSERFIEFFTANIRNRNTRMAYALAVRQFFGPKLLACPTRPAAIPFERPASQPISKTAGP